MDSSEKLIMHSWDGKFGVYFMSCEATREINTKIVAIGKYKLELQSGNTLFGSKSTLFWAVWPWNFKDDLQKQQGTYSMLL